MTLFLTVVAYTQFSDLTLICSSFSDDSVEPPLQLSAGVASAPIQLGTNQVQDFLVDTADLSDVSCSLEGNSGDADLFLRWSEHPVLDARFPIYDCSSEGETSIESCEVVNPGNATALWARIFAFQSADDVVITCTPEPLADGPTDAPVDSTGSSNDPTAAPIDTDNQTQPPSPSPVADEETNDPTTAPIVVETPAPSADESAGTLRFYVSQFGVWSAVFCFYNYYFAF
jgi:hypothetical protein